MPIDNASLLSQAQAKLAAGRRTWVKRQTLNRWAGVTRASASVLDEIERTLLDAGLGLDPLPLRNVRPDERVTLAPSPLPDRGVFRLDREQEIEELLLRYWRHIPELAGLRSLVSQKQLLHEERLVRCDLYGRDNRGVVVVELKLAGGGYRPASQIREYIKGARRHQATLARPKPVRGIVIATEPNPSEEFEIREWAALEGVTVDWYYFRLELMLVRAQW